MGSHGWRFGRGRTVAALASVVLLYLVFAGPAHAVPALPSGFADQAVLEPVSYGTTVAFAPDGRMFFSTNGGLVRVRTPSGAVSTITKVAGTLFSIAVDKDFATNNLIYVLHQTGRPRVVTDGCSGCGSTPTTRSTGLP